MLKKQTRITFSIWVYEMELVGDPFHYIQKKKEKIGYYDDDILQQQKGYIYVTILTLTKI